MKGRLLQSLGLGGWLVGSFFVVVFGVDGLDLVTFNCFLLFLVVFCCCGVVSRVFGFLIVLLGSG
jgi:hypothetical protein